MKKDYKNMSFDKLLAESAHQNGLIVEYRNDRKECYICNADDKHIVKCKYSNKNATLCVQQNVADMLTAEGVKVTRIQVRYSFPYRYVLTEKNITDFNRIVKAALQCFNNDLKNKLERAEKKRLANKITADSDTATA